MRRAANVDRNQGEIVKYLRGIGASVTSLATVGGGVPDLLVGFLKCNYLFEVKDGRKPPSARRLSETQVKWHKEWAGQVFVVECVEDVKSYIDSIVRLK
jgi:hypothetical protein